MKEENTNSSIHELLEKHQKQLRFFIFGIYPNHDAAEDILQETNKVIWSKRTDFQSGSNFLAWARTIAKFQTLSYLKSRNAKTWLHFDSDLVHDLAQRMEDRSPFLNARKSHLADCIAALPNGDQELVFRKYERNETNKLIGREIGRSEGGLKQAYLRIRKLLRECVERKEAAKD